MFLQHLKELLLLACTNVLFSFNGKLFIQHEGMAMGSILGPTMAAFALNLIESRFNQYSGNMPLLFYRYVDDCLAFFTSQDGVESFQIFLNSHHSSFKFTVEHQSPEKTINFLDTNLKNVNGSVEVSWRMKETNTGIYTPFCSYAPYKYKTAAMRSLFLSS